VITHLRGILRRLDADDLTAHLEVGGVTYSVLVPLFLWGELQKSSDEDPEGEISLHIFYHVTANQPSPLLVGFLRWPERQFFKKFTTVEGIGPLKAAKAMNMSVSTIARAIEQEDRAALNRMPGIGARAAEKIIATLRGKLTAEAALQDGEITAPVNLKELGQDRVTSDAVQAISALGYSAAEARQWVDEAMSADASLDSVESITLAVLRSRGGG